MRIGTANDKIIVNRGVDLGGYAQKRPWDGEEYYPLEINVVYFKSENEREDDLVLLSIDATFANELSRRLKLFFGSDKLTVLVSASHTHYSPSLMPEFPALGLFNEDFCQSTVELSKSLIADARLVAEKNNKVATVSGWQVGAWSVSKRRRMGFSVSRKFPILHYGMVMQPVSQQEQLVPINVSLIRAGESNVVVWSFQCHPTGFYAHNSVSSEFIGIVRDQIRKSLDSTTTVIFLQGASGDLREPHISTDPKRFGWLNSVLGLLSGYHFNYVQPSKDEWEKWAFGLSSRVVECLERAEQEMATPITITSRSISASVDQCLGPHHPVEELEITTLDISKLIQLVFVNAEVTSELASKVSSLYPDKFKPVFATNINECLGYITTAAEYSKGGYEAGRWAQAFGSGSTVESDAENLVVNMYESVLDETSQRN